MVGNYQRNNTRNFISTEENFHIKKEPTECLAE